MPKDNHPPAFLMYVDDFASDGVVEAMTTEQVGAYTLLLLKAWKEEPPGSIPDNDHVLARWCRLSLDAWTGLKAGVLAAFRFSERDKRYHQKRMQKEWAKLQFAKSKRKESASYAATVRHNRNRNQLDTCEPHTSRTATACHSISSVSVNSKKATNSRPPNAPPPLPLEDIRDTLHDYVRQSGIEWDPPDDALCRQVQTVWSGTFDDFGDHLGGMLKRHRKPSESYAWFLTVLRK